MIFKNGTIQGKEFNEGFGDYTVVGTPTIQGTILSNCSQTSFLRYNFTNPPRTSDSVITFCGSFVAPSTKTIYWVVNKPTISSYQITAKEFYEI